MSHTDDLIGTRRRSTQVGDRREFSVDRGQAIRKMRQFALEDPSYYLLELIQAAIANDSGFLNVDLFRLHRDRDDLKMWWSGRGFRRFELERLFDFLLISEDEPGCADTILLARGVNAMLHFEPLRVSISSGDGTLDGSVKIVITGDGHIEAVEAPEPISGVRIHGEELHRSLLAPLPQQRLGDREVALLREKVIAPGVQVMLNGHFISDWNSAYVEQRQWRTDAVDIEEDDLYGRLWKAPFEAPGRFDIMTWGVKIERLEREGAAFRNVYGAVNFNRLNKTADHAKIVRDEVLDELWARLRPYVDRLQSGRGDVAFDIRRLDGAKFRPPDLVALLRTHDRVVIVGESQSQAAHLKSAACDVARALDAPILVVPEGEAATLEMLSGGSVELVAPRLEEARDVEVFTGPLAAPPPRPWLVEPMNVAPMPAAEFVRYVCDEHKVDQKGRAQLARIFNGQGSVQMHVYSPDRREAGRIEARPSEAGPSEAGPSEADKWVKVLVCEREVFCSAFRTAFGGHELVIELPPVSPSLLFETVFSAATGEREPIVELAARTCVHLAQPRLEEASKRARAALRRISGGGVDEVSTTRYLDEEKIEERQVRGVIGLPFEPVDEFGIDVLDAQSGEVYRLDETARELGLVGRLVAYDQRVIDDEKAWLEEVVRRHGERLLERLMRRLPRLEDDEQRDLAAKTLLEFASRKLRFFETSDAGVDWEVDHLLARRILEVPLFPGRRRLPVSPARLIGRLCAHSNLGKSGDVVDDLLARDAPASVRRWVETFVDLSRRERLVSNDGGESPQCAPHMLRARKEHLLEDVESLLDRLRPDRVDLHARSKFCLSWASRLERDPAEEAPDGQTRRRSPCVHVERRADQVDVRLDEGHRLVERAKHLETPEATAWLLLTIYAGINERSDAVTDEHEISFQRQVADALEAGDMVADSAPVATRKPKCSHSGKKRSSSGNR